MLQDAAVSAHTGLCRPVAALGQGGEPVLKTGDRLRAEAVIHPAALIARFDQTGVPQHAQMERQPRLGQAELAGEVADTALAPAQGLHHRQANRISKGLEQKACLLGQQLGLSSTNCTSSTSRTRARGVELNNHGADTNQGDQPTGTHQLILMHQVWLMHLSPPVMRIGINGFGRIGRLVFRALWGRPNIELVHVNEIGGDGASCAHLLAFDSVHGRWEQKVSGDAHGFRVNEQPVSTSQHPEPTAVPWRDLGVDLVLECSGRFKTPDTLQPYFETCGLKRVVVACPVKGVIAGEEALNVVFGINHQHYEAGRHRLVTAASCTTNCLAPVVKVVHETFGIRHGSITTLHDVTNTQVVVDGYKSDLRRARSCLSSLIPTTTGSAKAIGLIFPELQGKLNGHAVRVPLLNASLTDAVFELERVTTVEEVNGAFAAAASGALQGILGYEERPLVSVDYVNDNRSAVIDGLSTMVVNGTQLKVYAWYDNEWGYSSRMADLVSHIVAMDGSSEGN